MTIRRLAALALCTAALVSAGAAHAQRHHDHDGNPPGPAGGRGSNWENRPGPRGGPGASPDRPFVVRGVTYRFTAASNGYYYHPSYGYWLPDRGLWNARGRCWIDFDNNPPGPRGGRGTNWENPPGWRGGPGASPDRYGRCR